MFQSFLFQTGSANFIWLTSDNMHHQWLLLAACFWVIFMFMVASKFIALTFKEPDGKFTFNV